MLYNRYYTEVSRSVRQQCILLVLLVISQATWVVDKQTEETRNNGHWKVIRRLLVTRGAPLLTRLYTGIATHMVGTHIFGLNSLVRCGFVINMFSRVSTSELGNGIGYCDIVSASWQSRAQSLSLSLSLKFTNPILSSVFH